MRDRLCCDPCASETTTVLSRRNSTCTDHYERPTPAPAPVNYHSTTTTTTTPEKRKAANNKRGFAPPPPLSTGGHRLPLLNAWPHKMSVSIALDNPPEFYTNLDVISGKVVFGISRPEHIGAVIVKLEGESKTALGIPDAAQDAYPQPTVRRRPTATESSQVVHENHKVLYKVQQVFPGDNIPAYSVPVALQPGQHEWAFNFKLPFNNACGDPNAMAKIGGLAGAGGFAGPSLFGMGGIRLMDGSKQLFYKHVTKTLPPSFTGFPRQAEVRYYIKVTIQRPGLFKENFRHQLGFKFLPIEPPRPPPTNQEAYARRPFTFRPKSPGLGGPSSSSEAIPKKGSRFTWKGSSNSSEVNGTSSSAPEEPPSIEISARLPHPSIITCNKPIPLRLLARKLVDSRAECYLTSIQIDLIGSTLIRCQDLANTETSRWIVVSRHGLAVPLQRGPDDAVDAETEITRALWDAKPLPNTVMPSFATCNLRRTYALEINLGVSWGKPPGATDFIPDAAAAASPSGSSLSSKVSSMSLKKPGRTKSKGKGKNVLPNVTQTIFLPLQLSAVQVYSGLSPPESLAQAAMKARQQQTQPRPPRRSNVASVDPTPVLPPRQQPSDPLYPPQLRPGQSAGQASASASGAGGAGTGVASTSASASSASAFDVGAAPPYDDAPPSYDEAMAVAIGPDTVVPAQARPAYSGVTNENSPDSLPQKN